MAIYSTNVKAVPMLLPNVVNLSWTNPTDASFDHIEVYRRTDQFQSVSTDTAGTLIYSGTKTSIYDYWADATKVPQHEPDYPYLAVDDLSYLVNLKNDPTATPPTYSIFNMPAGTNLVGGQLYYYTVFAVDTSGNSYATMANMVSCRPTSYKGWDQRLWDRLPEVYKQQDINTQLDPTGNGYGQLRRFIWLLSLAYEYMHSKIQEQQYLVSFDNIAPEHFDYLANEMGWSLDKSVSLATQRTALRNAINIYNGAGTKQGLDTLVRIYSGYPTSSGVTEGSTLLLVAPIFSNSQVYDLDRVAPDFGLVDPTTAPTATLQGSGSVGVNLLASTGYSYQVCAYPAAGMAKYGEGYTNPSPTSAIITEGTTPYPIFLSWDSVPYSGGYVIFRNGQFLKDVGNVTSYTDAGNDTPQATPALPTSNQTGDDFTQVGKGTDPLKYDYDFSSNNKTGSQQFTAYVQPTSTLTSDQVTALQTKLQNILNQFVPAGVTYTVSIYN